jgi:hypothetical protein
MSAPPPSGTATCAASEIAAPIVGCRELSGFGKNRFACVAERLRDEKTTDSETEMGLECLLPEERRGLSPL